jgi:porin
MRPSFAALLLAGLPLGSLVAGDESADPLVIDDAAPFSDRLLGDWGGVRSSLADHGVTLNLDGTYSLQGVADGGTRFGHDEGNLFAGQLGLLLDTGKAGLWPGGFLSARVEGRGGDSVLRRAGTTSPVNNGAILPLIPGSLRDGGWGLTELTYAQFLRDQFGLVMGLINTDSGDANPIAGSLGSDEFFMNTGLLYSPVAISTVPNVTPGGGILWIPSEENEVKLLVIGTSETAGHNPFERYEGTTFLGEWATKFRIADRPSGSTLSASYSIGEERLRLSDDPRLLLADYLTGTPLASTEDSWSIMWNGYHYVSGDETGGWGFFGRFGVSDGDPNPIDWAGAAGLGGIGLLPGRERDRWGLGLFHQSFADDGFLAAAGITEETGAELFYNIALGRGTNLTLDVQCVDSAVPRAGTVVVLGARLGVRF